MKKYYHKLLLVPVLFVIMGNNFAQTKKLGLKDALHIAAKGNRQLQIRWMENQQAAEAVKEAKSFLLPTVTATSAYNIYTERPVIYLRNEVGSPKLKDVKYGGRIALDGAINASYPILNPVLKSNIRLATISEQVSEQQTKATEEQLALNIAQLYLTILMYKEQLQLLHQSIQRNELALKDSRSLFLQGKSLKTDTLSNYIAVQNLQAAASALQNNIHVFSVQLKELMGMEDSIHLVLTDSLIGSGQENASPVLANGYAEALHNRKDVKIQSLWMDYNKEQLHQSKASFKPQLSAVAQYQVQGQADNLKFWDHPFPRSSFAGVKMSLPIYSGNRLKSKTIQADLAIQRQALVQTELQRSVKVELVTLKANLQEALHQLQIKQQNEGAAQVNYKMMNERYRNGLGSRLELTDAELALTRAKLDQLQAVYSIRLAELQLKKAMGLLEL